MKNCAMPVAVTTVGLGLLSIGFNLNGNQANATPAVFNAGPAEPTIVWYGTVDACSGRIYMFRAWSNALVEGRQVQTNGWYSCGDDNPCVGPWIVISSANEGLNAAADINFDERVDAADLGQLIAAWGDAPRNDYPPSDCPFGLIP